MPPRRAAENMARDSALLDRARDSGEAVFSVYGWERPALSLGRNQVARRHYDLAKMAREGIDVVRRPTGGRALLHHREVTYSVTAPAPAGESLHDSYARINAILLAGLARLGLDAREATGTPRVEPPGTLPCFAEPAEGELVVGAAKLVGSAQVRENGALLQHGSILVEDDQQIISELLLEAEPRASHTRVATLAAALGRTPSLEEVAAGLFSAVRELEDVDAEPLDESGLRPGIDRHFQRYASDWWTWRR